MSMALTGDGPGLWVCENCIPLLKVSKSDVQSNVPRKPRMWSQVVMDMD